MNILRPSSIGGAFGLVLFGLVAARGSAAPATAPSPPPGEPIAQLAPGNAPGTFHLVYRSKARFTMDGHCALQVCISDGLQDQFAPTHVADAGEFSLEADLRPGTYRLSVAPEKEENADYWPSDWQDVHIDKAGRLYRARGWLSPAGDFVLDRRMKVAPDSLAVADDRQPVLKWPAVPGATHYRGDYRGGGRWKWFDIEETQYVIGGGLKAGAWCAWRVFAMDAGGKTLARGEGSFLGQGTTPAAVAQMRAARGTCGMPTPAGRPYLGFQPMAAQVPKDAATATDDDPWHGQTVQDAATGFIPGIEVVEVLPDSPAVDAGLVPDDVIIAVDGQRVPSESNMGDTQTFVAQIAAMEPGRQVTLTVRRFPRELTLVATVGRFGAAATQPAPATKPAAPPAPVVARPVEGGAWSDVDAGSPARKKFSAKPGADIPLLSTAEGLASDYVTQIAELPGGGMAFGTREGLSIWDGAEISTYTGPSFSASVRQMVDGNSGLPSDSVQDLLCDSRRRLWVATSSGVCRIENAPTGRWRLLGNPDHGSFASRGIDQTMDVQKIFEASDGTIVLGARCSAITLIDPKTDVPRLIHRDDDGNHWVTGIAEDRRHRLWFAVRGVGVLRYDAGKIEQVDGAWIGGTNVRSLCIDGAGTIWVAEATAGLSALHADGTTEKASTDGLPGDYIEHLMTDRSGRLWVVCNEGLAVHSTGDASRKAPAWQYAHPADLQNLTSLINTGDGAWWVSGFGAARHAQLSLASVNPRDVVLERFKRTIESTWPRVKPDKQTAIGPGGIVVGVADKRLLRFDGKKWEDLSAQVGRLDVSEVRADSKGTVWVATSGQGLIGLGPGGAIRRYNNDPDHSKCVIYSLDETPDGILYAGTQDGVYRLRGQTWEHLESDLFQVGQVLADRRGRVWMMEITYHNLYVYDGKRFREVKDQTAIGDEALEWGSLRLDAQGRVLVDVPARPAENLPRRTFRWDATVEGAVGPPVEVPR